MFEQNIIIFLLTFVFVYCTSISDNYVTHSTKYGPITGKLFNVSGTEAKVFLGVPYASPPVGDFRFEYPIPPPVWNESLLCIKFQAVCPQMDNIHNSQSEDCLYLNIITPNHNNNTSTPYPVLVWIHGGSYFTGTGNKFPLNTTITNLVAYNIIVVYVNYRLGPLGFLSLGNTSLSGNYGLEDQLFALRWVHENIAYFNGDPNQVTITGESAGGASVSLLAISKKSYGLIKRVLTQSGCSLSPWAVSTDRTKENSEKFLRDLHCEINESDSEFMSCLRQVKFQVFIQLLSKLEAHSIIFTPDKNAAQRALSHVVLPYFTPVVDDYRASDSILDESPENLLKHRPNLPLLIGCTNFEELDLMHYHCMFWDTLMNGRQAKKQIISINLNVDDFIFPFTPESENEIDWEMFIPASLFKNPKLAYQAIEKFYGIKKTDFNTSEILTMLAKIGSDSSFIAPSVLEADYYAKNNNSVYFYYYTEENNSEVIQPFEGCGSASDFPVAASHGQDMARLFQAGTLASRHSQDEWKTGNIPLTRFLSKMITNFVKTGNPNSENNLGVEWEKFTSKRKSALLLHANKAKMIDVEKNSNYNFWYEILPAVDNLQCK